MKNKILYMAMMMALAFTACSEEDIMQSTNGEAGTLRITSVSIEGQEAGRSRVAYEGSTTQEYLYNRSITGLSYGDKLTLNYTFNTAKTTAYAIMNGSEWALTSDVEGNTPVTINPIKNGGGIWNNVYMDASFGGGEITGSDEGYSTIATNLDIVQGNSSVIPTEQIKLLADALYADTNTDGGITINKDLNSPTLGTTTIALKHNRALLRVPSSSVSIDNNSSYIVNGSVCQVSGLATLWAVVEDNEKTFYYPFTKVSIESTDYLQVIVPVGSLTGFKAVLSSNTSTVTIDLPFKVDNAVSTNLTLASNTQYPLTLNISPNEAEVSFSSAASKPGWGNEDPLSNDMNDLVIYAETELSYNVENNTFSVSGPSGLQLLNRWMAKSITTPVFKSVNFVGYDNLADNKDPLSVNVLLTQNITLPTVGEGESNWTPIGNSSNIYSGVFDGNNKTIKNLTIVDGSSSYLGLIGTLSGTVQNLKLENAKIDGSTFRKQNFSQVGGIVGAMQDGANVLGCTVSGNIWGGNSYVGGIVGTAGTGFLIENCITAVGSEVKGFKYVGGILGESARNTSNRSRVTGCINKGTVVRPEDNSNEGGLGGIVANGKALEITNCTNEGTLTSYDDFVYQGGILGKGITCKLENCTNIATATLTVRSISEYKITYLGGIMGFASGETDVKGCINHASIAFTYNRNSNYVGGIVGHVNTDMSGTGFVACGNTGSITISAMEGATYPILYVGGICGYNYDKKFYGCWTRKVVEHCESKNEVDLMERDGFGYVSTSNSINKCYIAKGADEAAQKVFINGKVRDMNDVISDYGWQWDDSEEDDWPTLTPLAPVLPAQGN